MESSQVRWFHMFNCQFSIVPLDPVAEMLVLKQGLGIILHQKYFRHTAFMSYSIFKKKKKNLGWMPVWSFLKGQFWQILEEEGIFVNFNKKVVDG